MKPDRHLIPLHPVPHAPGPCPGCGSGEVRTLRTGFPGIPVLAHCTCDACGLAFTREMPVSHALSHPVTVVDGRTVDRDRLPGWIVEPFEAGMTDPDPGEVAIERRVYRKADRIVLLNTLDFLYGHVLLKLYNALHYIDRHPDLGLVLLIPRMYEWLIPEGCAEAWIVDLRLGPMQRWHPAIDRFVQERLPGYSEAFLAPAYSHPDMAGADMARFTKVPSFEPSTFTTAPPHVTFVTREDRIWIRNGAMRFLHRVLRRIGPRPLWRAFILGDQDRLIRRTMKRIGRRLPAASFSVVGLGAAASWPDGIEDLRTMRMDVDTEKAWCRAYGRSQVVVGVHGSNMLLPTALAGSCVEILPRQRLENMVQDVTVRYQGRAQLFHYRFVDEFASPAVVASNVVSIFVDRDTFMRNNHVNVF